MPLPSLQFTTATIWAKFANNFAIASGILLALLTIVSFGGRWITWVNLVSNFAHILAVLGGGTALCAVFVRTSNARRAALFLGLSAAATSAALVLTTPDLRPAYATPDGGPRLKVIQFNLKPGRDDDEAIAAWLAREQPDLLVLQDLKPALMSKLASRLTGMSFTCTLDCEVTVAARAPLFDRSTHGRGVYGLTPTTLVTHFEVGGAPAILVATHLARPTFGGKASPTRTVQVQAANLTRLQAILDGQSRERMIVVGDFNATPWSWAGRRIHRLLGLERRTSAEPTWPVMPLGGAMLPIDHIYAGADWKTLDVRRGPRLGSDHYPVVAVLELRGP